MNLMVTINPLGISCPRQRNSKDFICASSWVICECRARRPRSGAAVAFNVSLMGTLLEQQQYDEPCSASMSGLL